MTKSETHSKKKKYQLIKRKGVKKMNLAILSGNVCTMFDNQHNVRLTIADNYKDNTDYITVTLFSNQADFARKYITKGDHVSIEGRITTYKDNTGKDIMGITAKNISFEGYKNPKKTDIKQEKGFTEIHSEYEQKIKEQLTENDTGDIYLVKDGELTENDLPF